MSEATLLECLVPLTDKVRCPSCRLIQSLEESETAGAKDGCVICKRCHRQFEPIPMRTQERLFGEIQEPNA